MRRNYSSEGYVRHKTSVTEVNIDEHTVFRFMATHRLD